MLAVPGHSWQFHHARGSKKKKQASMPSADRNDFADVDASHPALQKARAVPIAFDERMLALLHQQRFTEIESPTSSPRCLNGQFLLIWR
jgi:hypothetical protein